MEVSPNSSASATQKVTPKSLVTPAAQPAAGDTVSFRQADAVNNAVQQTPDVRADAVARARTMVNDDSYPPLSMIDAISRLIATKLNQDTPQE